MVDANEAARLDREAYIRGLEKAAELTTLRAEVERLRKAVKLWRDAYETRQNEPLVIAYEATAALAQEKPNE